MEVEGQGMMEPQGVELEDDSINFWASLGVSTTHVHGVDQMPALHNVQMVDHHVQLLPAATTVSHPQSVCKELFPVEADPCLEPRVGMEFESGEAAKTFYIAYAGRVGFSVRIARSRKSKCSESIIMLRFVCSKEGFSKEKRVVEGKKTRKRPASIREGCNAMLEVLRRGDNKWVVTKLVKEHNHEVGMPSTVHYIATESDTVVDPYIGMEFESLESAKTFYYSYAIRVGFEARVRQSRKSQDESLKMLKLVCSRHRYHSGRETNAEDAKRGQALDPLRDGCEALFEIIRKQQDVWMVSKLIIEHTHELNPAPPSRVCCVRSQGEILVIAKNFADTRNLLLNGQDSQPSREIRYNDLGPEDAQSLLEYLRKVQVEDPAFFYAVQLDKNEQTVNIFWADANARMAYYHFGDAVRFETAYRNSKEHIPIVIFSGVNHHVQPVVFGCALLVDESEKSFAWLFEKWLEAMHVRPPVSFVTELNQQMAAAAAKVLPDTCHIFCEKHIFGTVKEELHNIYPELDHFITDLRKCIDECRIEESFESCWDSVLIKHGFRNNEVLRSLYDIRQQWAPAYTKKSFHAANLLPQSSENFEKIIDKYFSSKTQLQVSVQQLGKAICSFYEKEAQADYLTMVQVPALRTASPMEKQASLIFTRTVFDIFQEQFAESFGYHAERLEDGMVHRYRVTVDDGDEESHTVTFSPDQSTVCCSCCLFESCGILCRHALRVFIIEGVRFLPKAYVLKRWTKHAKSTVTLDNYTDLRGYSEDPSTSRYNDLCYDAIKCAKEGSASSELYKIAKDALHKALDEVMSLRNTRQQNLPNRTTSLKSPVKKFGKAKDTSAKSLKSCAATVCGLVLVQFNTYAMRIRTMKIILVALAGSEKAWKNGAEGQVCFEVKTIKKNTNALKAPNYCFTCLIFSSPASRQTKSRALPRIGA
ncbi:protein FAR1-RELATED SEQUENCE 5 isoform X4 [Brachypodium distachyon]|uniref:protein FAR1-RELATED SEQUENCE 5 isoform X4 n=1 Tax=Brachypodium distachyon TaxID=15368 RepID=UPI00071D814D|nr:protein FAR1-RELATED SEQUENCE 5 isoform X4 [Brachypodium distachyon]|eukprot:XP_014756690.1 protein FAR1-RELATED SEQUENCE 5 isoform X4 [Brachypodium distachyon]